MKYLLALLTSTLLLVSCSQNDPNTDPATFSTPTTDTEANEEAGEANADDAADNLSDDAETEYAETEDNEDDKSDTEGIDQKNVKLVVKNQTTAGQIIVEKVATSRDGWLSVHKSEEGGGIKLPDSIGEARVDSGDSEEVVIDLWEAPDIDEKLWVLLHIDAGERGTYEFPGDDQPVRKNGETMARSFVIQDPNPDEEEEDE